MMKKGIIVIPEGVVLQCSDGDEFTIYKNTENLYVAILKGVEIGLLQKVDETVQLDTCLKGKFVRMVSETEIEIELV